MKLINGKYDHLLLILSLSLLSLTIGFSAFIRQSDFVELVFFYGFFFVVYLLIYRYIASERAIYILLGLGIILRLITVLMLPNLSDDFYRFIWDGRLMINGYSPFAELPAYYLENGIEIPGISPKLYIELNSKEYFTVYPPVPQGIFAFAGWCSPYSIAGSVLVMKSIFLLFEIGTLFLLVKLLQHFTLPLKNALLYALNPLILLDTFANLHFEIALIFFLVLSIWLLVQNQWQLSAIAMTFAIASKLLPLMFLPFLIRQLGWKRAMAYFSIITGLLLLLFLPFFNAQAIHNFGESLNLYFQRFEFNASVYYALRWLGFQLYGHNVIQVLGPTLAGMTAFWILWYALLRSARPFDSLKRRQPTQHTVREDSPSGNKKDAGSQLPRNWLFAMTLFLLLTTTIHPWYLSSLIVLCVFTRFRFPILWSGLIMLTYINYSYGEYYENLWVVGLEYLLVFGFLFWELRESEKNNYQFTSSSIS